jgi:acyl CoA:acetate/3-ketoacid CoA transferase alpha subunit
MPLAAQTVIAEVDELSETALNPNHVVVPGIFVDYVVVRGKNGTK